MKKLVFAAFALCAAGAFAEDTEEELVKYGGLVTKSDPSNGNVTIVNGQTRVAESNLAEVVKFFDQFLQVRTRLVSKDDGDSHAKFRIVVKDDPNGKSMVLVSPEEGWAELNVARVAAASADPELLASRTQRELVRTYAWLCGSGSSRYPHTLMSPVKKMRDLDYFFKLGLPPDVLGRMSSYLKECGVRAVVTDSYLAACEDGWAPKPANKYQQAIWDKVHQMPTKPMTIEPEKK